MSKLQIYEASAGAGKTFRLTIEYLKLALRKEYAYKNILAVTFTNKATSEMKARVLTELYKISKGEQTSYLDILTKDPELNLSAAEIKSRSQNTLRRILHDFSRFSISTIDSFFQRVIKSFNKELGINGNFQVELNNSDILDEAIDQVILSIDDDPELFKWIIEFSDSEINDGGSWNIATKIRSLSNEIFKESFREESEKLFKLTSDLQFFRNYISTLKEIEKKYFVAIQAIGKQGVELLSSSKLTANDFKGKSKSPVNKFNEMLSYGFIDTTKTMRNCSENEENLIGKDSPAEAKNIAAQLSNLLKSYFKIFDEQNQLIMSTQLILKQIYSLGVLTHVHQKIQQITHENNISLLAESNQMLQEIIDKSDTPFIYERTGITYKNFMIDEFQDTSTLQWNNFRPLLSNSLGEGNLAMLVGDVKQAIYRWRGGDWKLLANQVTRDFASEGSQIHQLTQNWRSTGEVIRFNNRFFNLAPQLLQNNFNAELEKSEINPQDYNNQIVQNFANSVQLIGQESQIDSGYVQMHFIKRENSSDENYINTILDELTTAIKDIQDRGGKASEIAILVREKKEAKPIVSHLLTQKNVHGDNSPYNFSLISSDGLLIKNSPSVNLLICLIGVIHKPLNKINHAIANHIFHSSIEPLISEMGETIDWEKALINPSSHQLENSDKNHFEELNDNNPFFQFLHSDFLLKDLSSRNIQEITFKLADYFKLFKISSDLSYLQTFVDIVSDFQQRKISDLSTFLDYWDENSDKLYVNSSESIDAIQIVTIHKSKGLEYKFVLIPFCNWEFKPSANKLPILWCKPTIEPLNKLNIVPVKFETKLINSIFKHDYFNEMQNMFIEALNLSYVAFTRARNELYIWSNDEKDKNEDHCKNIGNLLLNALALDENFSYEQQEELFCKLKQKFNVEDRFFASGSKTTFTLAKTPKKELEIKQFSFSDFDNYLKLRKNHDNFFNSQEEQQLSATKGKIIHEALAKIKTKDELDHALVSLQFKGLIPKNELPKYQLQITAMLKDPTVESWFDGSYEVLNERSVLLGNSYEIRRPDRIMIKDNNAIVVDYKSGEHEMKSHEKQVAEYMTRLKECGYEKVSGYIWYTRNNYRKEVFID
ncbi:MAG: UvrD-helicase domain-containing protein [Mangrovibacterium sp.]